MMAGVDHLGLDPDRGAVRRSRNVEFGNIETQGVEPTYSALDPVQLGAAELLDAGQFVPQLRVPGLNRVNHAQRLDRPVQHPPGLQIAEVAENVHPGNRKIMSSLARAQLVVQFAGLRIHQVGSELAGVAAEKDVGKRHIAPHEPRQVQPDDQHHHRVQ